jgi:hypothetical protein
LLKNLDEVHGSLTTDRVCANHCNVLKNQHLAKQRIEKLLIL